MANSPTEKKPKKKILLDFSSKEIRKVQKVTCRECNCWYEKHLVDEEGICVDCKA